MKVLDSSVMLLFLHDIDGKEYLNMLSKAGETLLIPDSVHRKRDIKDLENFRRNIDI